MTNVIGIDLGTTNTVVAVVRDGRAHVIATAEGDTLIPSVVCADPITPEVLLVGRAAKSIMATLPGNAVFSTKRLMGMQYFDEEIGRPGKQAEDYDRFIKVKNELPYPLYPDPAGNDNLVRVKIGERFLKPEDVAELILRQAKQEAELFTGAPVTGAVITTPAYFENKQKAATKRAAEQAGIDVLALMDEPNAAAMSAGYRPDQETARWVLVFDFGGGTLDVSLLQISKEKDFFVFSKSGDNWLGGDDFDQCLMDLVEKRANQIANASANEAFELRRSIVKREVEAAKIQLSSKDKVVLNIANCALVRPPHGGQPRLVSVKDLEITRPIFEEKTRGILDKALRTVEEVFKDAPTVRRVINEVLLIGGSTYIPAVRRVMCEQFPGKVRIDEAVNPMHEVALGAAIYAHTLARQKEKGEKRPEHRIRDTVERSLGIECVDNKGKLVYVRLIPRQTPLDKAESEYRTFNVTRSDYLAIAVYAGEHEEARENRFQGRIQVDINPPVDLGHPVHIKLKVTEDRLIRVHARIDGREETVRELVYDGLTGEHPDEDLEKLDETLQFAQQFLMQYGEYIDEKEKEDLNKLCERGEKALQTKARLEATTVTRRIRRLVFYTDQVGNQLFQVDQLSHATALSQERKNQLRDLAYQAKALYQECQDNPTAENKRKMKQFGMVFETFLGMAFREASRGPGREGQPLTHGTDVSSGAKSASTQAPE